ncbi:MAG: hypothetical protein IJW60_04775 [Clostridia bacterium]|nr:hypothetical protein [Clostridia bacterium]
MRENTIKKTILTALSTLFVASATVGVATLTNAQATNDPSIMAAGASVRVKYDENNAAEAQDKNGIRFATYLKNVAASDIAESYALIIPTDLISGALTAETEGVKKEDLAGKWYSYTDATEGEVLRSMVVLYDVAKPSYSRNVTVETYVRLNDGTVLETNYQDENYKGTRSLDSVAEMAKADTEKYNALVAEIPQAAGILDAYDVNIAEGTFVDFGEVELTAGENESAAITATPAFWKNYYKNYNTFSVSVTIDGTVSDVTKLEYVAADETTKVNLPLNAFVDGVAKQIPVDFNFVNNYNVLTGGKFVATIADGSATTVTVAPMKASAVGTQTIDTKYWYSWEDKDIRMSFVDELKTAGVKASDVLAVQYNGAEVAYSLNAEKNRIVFADDTVTSGVGEGATDNKGLVIQTATAKYKMTAIAPQTKVFYETDDFFLEIDGEWYSYFDLSALHDDKGRIGYSTVTVNSKTAYRTAWKAYRLAADIDFTNETRVFGHKYLSNINQNQYKSGDEPKAGFNSGFYGEGHTLTGITVGKHGIFGYVGGAAQIKNLCLKDVKFTQDTTQDYSYILGDYVTGTNSGDYKGAKITNLYVSVAQGQNAVLTERPTGTEWSNSGMLAQRTSQYAVWTNCVFDFSQLGEINAVGKGLFTYGDTSEALACMNNVYVISKAPVNITQSKNSTTNERTVNAYDAANKADEEQELRAKRFYWTWGNSYSAEQLNGKDWVDLVVGNVEYSTNTTLFRYDDFAEMKAANRDFSAFTATGFWHVEDGVLAWGAAN